VQPAKLTTSAKALIVLTTRYIDTSASLLA
jgi:hypothetical protein